MLCASEKENAADILSADLNWRGSMKKITPCNAELRIKALKAKQQKKTNPERMDYQILL